MSATQIPEALENLIWAFFFQTFLGFAYTFGSLFYMFKENIETDEPEIANVGFIVLAFLLSFMYWGALICIIKEAFEACVEHFVELIKEQVNESEGSFRWIYALKRAFSQNSETSSAVAPSVAPTV